jgi:hypothetical protein
MLARPFDKLFYFRRQNLFGNLLSQIHDRFPSTGLISRNGNQLLAGKVNLYYAKGRGIALVLRKAETAVYSSSSITLSVSATL